MLVEAKWLAAVDAERLEGAPAAHERLVVHVDHWLVRRHEPAPGDGEGENARGHARTLSGARPIASSSGRAFTQDSSISSAGSESHTMPPPTQRWIRPSARAKVRIVSARSRSPLG